MKKKSLFLIIQCPENSCPQILKFGLKISIPIVFTTEILTKMFLNW